MLVNNPSFASAEEGALKSVQAKCLLERESEYGTDVQIFP